MPQDIRYLMDVIQPDQASFFMLTPLPGSHDHREMKKRGEIPEDLDTKVNAETPLTFPKVRTTSPARTSSRFPWNTRSRSSA